MRPHALAEISGSWQKRKSAEMRIVILEATVECLVSHGYAGLSTQLVTKRAGVSRGAMHHHFQSKMQLVAAVTEYIFYKRMQRFLTDFEVGVLLGDEDVVESATEIYWQSIQTREYAAYVEIANAARTDRQLAEIFIPLSERFDRAWHEEMVRAFPQWRERLEKLQLVSDFVMSAHLGLLLNRELFGSKQRVRQVYDLITETVVRVHHGDMSAPPPAPLSPRHSD